MSPTLVSRRARKLKGLNAIRTLSLPPSICNVTAVAYHTFFSVWTPFEKVGRIVPNTTPNTIQCVKTWGEFMKNQTRDLVWVSDGSMETWQSIALKRLLRLTSDELAAIWGIMVGLLALIRNYVFLYGR